MKHFHVWSNLLTLLDIMFFTMVQNVDSDVTVWGQIKEDTGFYYQRLSAFPSKMATIEYTITFNNTNIELYYVNDSWNVVQLDIYTSENDQNLRKKCSNNGFGQVRNENLHTPLGNRGKPYRSTTCNLDEVDSDVLHCKGRTVIQDFIPRNYGFSIGYSCKELVRPSLRGMLFNFTISGQTNRTTCIKIPKYKNRGFKCHERYAYTSLPNFIGDLDKHNVWINSNLVAIILEFFVSSNKPFCYKYFKEFACRVAYPECNPVNTRVVHICRETCYDFVESCFKIFSSFLQNLNSSRIDVSWKRIEPMNARDELDCDNLPSVNDTIPCFYKPVMCDPPPNVTNARIINGSEHDRSYLANFQAHYECVDKTFQMEGNSTVTCMFSGFWSETPRCSSVPDSSSTNPLLFVLPILIIPLCLWVVLCLFVWSRKGKSGYIYYRHKEYDAFVCYY